MLLISVHNDINIMTCNKIIKKKKNILYFQYNTTVYVSEYVQATLQSYFFI